MSQIRIAPEAQADLGDIWAYLARRSRPAADRVTAGIIAKFATLARFPDMGASCEDLAPGLRSFVVGSYVIFYRPIDGGVEIVRVVHGSRDFSGLFSP